MQRKFHISSRMFGSIAGIFFPLFLIIFLFSACSSSSTSAASKEADAEPRDPTAQVLTAQASGEVVYGDDLLTLDASNSAAGYVMMQYHGSNEKVKVQIVLPDGTEYTYPVSASADYMVFPLTGGSGAYKVTLLESVSIEDNLYAVSFTQDIDVQIADEFTPFLYPNYYADFSSDSACVARGEELASDCYSDLDVITNIYNYVIENITYDTEKAQTVPYGYIPDPDDTLASGTGICFDYASLMCSMLRSQRIPTKLVVGYSGEVYHAWISCYVDEIGWVDNIIEFDGEHWSLMDPTLAAGNSAKSVKEYIGDGSNYTTKYTY